MKVVVPGPRDVRGTLDRADADEPSDGSAAAERSGPSSGDGRSGSSSADGRSVGASADERTDASSADERPRSPPVAREGSAGACVVACPPHPQHGGSRSDARLRAISDALCDREIDCLRFDYGPWDEGRGELADARAALAWAGERYERVGIAGYSFGGTMALLAAADADATTGPDPAADPDAAGEADATADPSSDPRVAACSAVAPAPTVGDELDAVDALARIACPVQVVYGSRDDVADATAVADHLRALAEVDPDAGHEVLEFATDHFFVGFQPRVADAVASFLDARLD